MIQTEDSLLHGFSEMYIGFLVIEDMQALSTRTNEHLNNI